jgi:hypothetical protein
MIHPTVGRIVWFGERTETAVPEEPLPAIITAVNKDGTVNLGQFSADGSVHPRQNVPLVQDGSTPIGYFCQWMPYQKGQAQKAEELQKKLDEKPPLTDLAESLGKVAETTGI